MNPSFATIAMGATGAAGAARIAGFLFNLALVSSVVADAGICGASKQPAPRLRAVSRFQVEERIDINAASVEELRRLPGVGPVLASRIVEHRHRHGLFKRPQDIVIVRGMSAKLYRRIAHLIRV